MQPHRIATWSELLPDTPLGVLASTVDLVVVRWTPEQGKPDDPDSVHSVLYGRCLHRGVRLADGSIVGSDLICGVHGWDYRLDSGVSSYNNSEALHRFEVDELMAIPTVSPGSTSLGPSMFPSKRTPLARPVIE